MPSAATLTALVLAFPGGVPMNAFVAAPGLLATDLPATIPWPLALLASGLAGILTALTPGLYPLIPVSLAAFGRSPLRRVSVSSLFGAGLAAALAALCGSASLFGLLAAAPLGSAAGLGFLTLLCMAMGSAMLGLFPLQLPPVLAARLAGARGSGPLAVGLVSLPVAMPWLAPPVAVLLAASIYARLPLQGASMAAAFAVGLTVPWLGTAVSGSRAAPRGVWMEVVRLVLAAAMWAVGLVFVAQAWPGAMPRLHQNLAYPGAYGMGLLTLGCGCGAFMLTSRRLANAPWLRATGALLMAFGLAAVLMEATRSPMGEAPAIAWETDHDSALAQARMARKPLVMDFTATWCQPCQQLERETYVDPAVRRAATAFVMAKIDCTAMDDATQALFARYKISGLPTVLFFDSDGQLQPQPRLTGYVGPARFVELLHSMR